MPGGGIDYSRFDNIGASDSDSDGERELQHNGNPHSHSPWCECHGHTDDEDEDAGGGDNWAGTFERHLRAVGYTGTGLPSNPSVSTVGRSRPVGSAGYACHVIRLVPNPRVST